MWAGQPWSCRGGAGCVLGPGKSRNGVPCYPCGPQTSECGQPCFELPHVVAASWGLQLAHWGLCRCLSPREFSGLLRVFFAHGPGWSFLPAWWPLSSGTALWWSRAPAWGSRRRWRPRSLSGRSLGSHSVSLPEPTCQKPGQVQGEGDTRLIFQWQQSQRIGGRV